MAIKVSLDGPRLTYTSDVTQKQAGDIIAYLAEEPGLAAKTLGKEEKITKDIPVGNDYESPRAAITTTKAKTNPQKIVALALYMGATSQNQKSFKVEEIKPLFGRAGEPTPKNMPRDFREAVRAGYIHEETDGVFRLLRVTDEAVSSGFDKAKKAPRQSRKTATKKEGKAGETPVRTEVENFPVTTEIDGYANFWSLKGRPAKILWILLFAEQHSISSLNRNEIIRQAQKLGEGLTGQNFTSAIAPVLKSGDVFQPTAGNYQLSKKAASKLVPDEDKSAK